MKPFPEQPAWLHAMICGLEAYRGFSVLMEGPRFAVVKEPGRHYMSGQESAYGAVDYILVDKTADPKSGTGICHHGISLQSGGRLTNATKAYWKTLVEAPNRETVDFLRAEQKMVDYCQHLMDTHSKAPRVQLMHEFGVNRAEAERVWGKWAAQGKRPPRYAVAEIAAARDRAEGLGAEHFNGLEIDWKKANRDKRAGTTHAWDITGQYLGQFKGHEQAILNGAVITQFANIWFMWGE